MEKILKGGRVSDLDLRNLDDAVIRLESVKPPVGAVPGKGVEGGAPNMERNIYVLRFDSGGGTERQVQLLKLQREILKNQLILLKTLGTIANYQVLLGTRTARVENTMRDITLGMKASGSEMQKVLGETAGTSAKMTDVASTTSDMAVELKDVSKNIKDVESTIDNVDMMIGKMSGKMDSMASDTERGMKKMSSEIESGSSRSSE
ncbi:MAG: hypothetical protein NT045_09075 [Candidatus Aureabacteria bacterium]|nr:hypothetical protein [Candidatus Auribacterota bacterium]